MSGSAGPASDMGVSPMRPMLRGLPALLRSHGRDGRVTVQNATGSPRLGADAKSAGGYTLAMAHPPPIPGGVTAMPPPLPGGAIAPPPLIPGGMSAAPPASRRFLAREGPVLATLLLLACVLLPAWADAGGFGLAYESQITVEDPVTGRPVNTTVVRIAYAQDLLRTAMNPWLLPALGLLWVVATGGVDLSVWVVFALGAAVAARVAAAGASPLLMLAAVASVGSAVGLAHAAAAYWLRLPSWGVTLLGAVVLVSVVAALTGGQPLPLELKAELRWPGAERPVTVTGWFFVVAILAGLFLGQGRRRGRAEGPAAVAAALTTSSVLSALGGMCWLIRNGWSPAPGHLFGDLRVAAAVALAGAVLVRTRGGRLVAGLLLVPGMLLATAWRQCVNFVPGWPAEMNVLLLTVMVLAAQWVVLRSFEARWRVLSVVSLAAPVGIVVAAVSAWERWPAARSPLQWTGLALWAAPAVGGLIAIVVRRRPAAAVEVRT